MNKRKKSHGGETLFFLNADLKKDHTWRFTSLSDLVDTCLLFLDGLWNLVGMSRENVVNE
jgi:hypothetical protein